MRSEGYLSTMVTFDMLGVYQEEEDEIARKRAEMGRVKKLLEWIGVEMPVTEAIIDAISEFADILPDPCEVPTIEEPDTVFHEQDRIWATARAEQIRQDLKELAEQQDEGPEFTSLGLSMPAPHRRNVSLGPINRNRRVAVNTQLGLEK